MTIYYLNHFIMFYSILYLNCCKLYQICFNKSLGRIIDPIANNSLVMFLEYVILCKVFDSPIGAGVVAGGTVGVVVPLSCTANRT